MVCRQHVHHRSGDRGAVRNSGEQRLVVHPRHRARQRSRRLLHVPALSPGAEARRSADDSESGSVRLLRGNPPAGAGPDDLRRLLCHRAGTGWPSHECPVSHPSPSRRRRVRTDVHRPRHRRLPVHPPVLTGSRSAKRCRVCHPAGPNHRGREHAHPYRDPRLCRRAVRAGHLNLGLLAAHVRTLHRRLFPLPARGNLHTSDHRLDVSRQCAWGLRRDDPRRTRCCPRRRRVQQ
ncbi:hypothetical protein BPS26883_01757 [Burkholderia pseudomultivorans]|uniref:Uncharacterized protein n=1 Tax=Burkholderia pseudomultivorans TaxID=1207504 RepID=A0A6P2J5X8_9BURK|nr:hypothetical protein BPS26883_01757 [Burkholderia pseudomultivorans]